MSPIVEPKRHRVIRVTRRLGFDARGEFSQFSIELVSDFHPADTAQVTVTESEFASISACYESMKYQRDMIQIERDPNVYEPKGGA